MADPFDYLYQSDFAGNEEMRRLEAEQAVGKDPGFIDSIGPAFRMSTLTYGAWKKAGMPSYAIDPDYRLDTNEYARLTKGIPEEFHRIFMRSRSKLEADQMREDIMQELRDREAVAAAGISGTAAMLGVNLLDPPQLALAWATGGYSAAGRASALARFVYGGAAAAGTNMLTELAVVNTRYTQDAASQIAMAGLYGFALGGPLGLLSRGENLRALEVSNNGAKAVGVAAADTNVGKAAAYSSFTPESIRTNKGASAHVATGEPPVGGFMVSEPGELRIPVATYKHQDALDFLGARKAQMTDPDNAYLGAWLDKDDVVLDISRNHTGYAEAVAAGKAAKQDAIYDVTKDDVISLMDQQPTEPKPRIKGPPAVLKDKEDLFLEGSVGAAQINRIPDDGSSFNQIRIPGTNLHFSLRYDIHAQLDRSKNPKVRALNKRWFEDAVGGKTFKWTDAQGVKHVQKAAQRTTLTGYATMEFKRFWAPVRELMNDTFDDYAVANKLSFKERNSPSTQVKFFTDVTNELWTPGYSRDPFVLKLANEMRQMKKGLNDELNLMGWTHADPNKLEMDFFDDLDIKTPVNARQYLELDARVLGADFSKKTTGYLGAAKVGIRSLADRKAVYDELLAAALPGDIQTKEALELFDKGWKWATGAPLDHTPFSTARDTMALVKSVNFVRAMGQVGFAQLAELGNLLGFGGMRAFRRAMPAFDQIVELGKLGKLDTQLARDLSAMVGDAAWERANRGFTRVESPIALHPNLVRATNYAVQGRELVAHMSGLRQINNLLKSSTESVMTQRMADLANGVTKITDNVKMQLATAGLEEDQLDDVLDALRKYGTYGPDQKLLSLDGPAWKAANRESYDLFRMALFRDVNRVVQDTTIGENCWWMHTAIGQVATQFRSFMLGAWAKQTLYGAAHGGIMNPNVTFAWSASMLFGGMSYVAQTSINYAHDSEKRAKLLTTEKIAMAAFNRAGFSSLIPMITDTMLDVTGNPMLFSHSRSSGLPTTIFGNPTLDFGNRLYSSMKAVGAATLGGREGLNRGQGRQIIGLLTPNVIGIRNFIDIMGDQFPEQVEFEETELASLINEINQR